MDLDHSNLLLPLDLRCIQAFHGHLDETKGFDQDPTRNVAYFAEELGEVAHAVRRLSRPSLDEAETRRLRGELASELADCLAYVAKLANYHNIDLEAAYLEKMRCNEERNWRAEESPD